jgi:hypothetical protein
LLLLSLLVPIAALNYYQNNIIQAHKIPVEIIYFGGIDQTALIASQDPVGQIGLLDLAKQLNHFNRLILLFHLLKFCQSP